MFDRIYYTHTFTYAQGFAWRFCLISLVWGICFLVGSYAIYLISEYIKYRAKRKLNASAAEAFMDNNGINLDSSLADFTSFLQHERERIKQGSYRFHQGMYIISSLMSWFSLLCISIVPSTLSALGVISITASMVLTFLIAVCKFFGLVHSYCPSCIRIDKDRIHNSIYFRIKRFFKRTYVTIRLYKWRFIIFGVLGIAYSVLIPLGSSHTCVSYFNKGFGLQFKNFGLSTKFTRYLTLPTVCEKDEICHIYATLPEDASTGVFLNIHTGNNIYSVTVQYDTTAKHEANKTASLGFRATSKSFHARFEQRGDRYIHSVYLSGLNPATEYHFDIYYNNAIQRSGKYQTLPSKDMEKSILMIAGGDVGNTDTANDMAITIGENSPDIILIGGDLAYDNGIAACYYCYDLFLNMFNNLNTKVGRIVPFIFAIGNHDAGFRAFQDGNIDITNNLFFTYFPQHSKPDQNGGILTEIPDLTERRSYSYHTFGNILQVSLDSGYMTSYNGAQLDFLKNTSEQYRGLVKLAAYHNPMYPVCITFDHDDIRTLEQPLLYWAQVFQDYKFATVHENHIHLFKKTYPIYNEAANPGGEGVIYLGDGNWGVDANTCDWAHTDRNQTEVFEKIGATNHVWMVKITNETLTYLPIDKNGKKIYDSFSLNVSNHILN